MRGGDVPLEGILGGRFLPREGNEEANVGVKPSPLGGSVFNAWFFQSEAKE